jgi:hypothetical protein
VKKFHLPLPERTCAELLADADRAREPATPIARKVIGVWLRARMKALRHKAIAAYAAETAGTELDLDPLLESAAVEQLMKHAQ